MMRSSAYAMVLCLSVLLPAMAGPPVIWKVPSTGIIAIDSGTATNIDSYITVHLDTGQMKYYTKVHYSYDYNGNHYSNVVWDSRNDSGGAVWNDQIYNFTAQGSSGADTFDFSTVTKSNYPNLYDNSSGSGNYATTTYSGEGSDDVTMSPTSKSYVDLGSTSNSIHFDFAEGSSEDDDFWGPSANLAEAVGNSGVDTIEIFGEGLCTGNDGSDWLVAFGDNNELQGGNAADLMITPTGVDNFILGGEPNSASGIHDYIDVEQSLSTYGEANEDDTGYRDDQPVDDIEKIESAPPKSNWHPFSF